jgi:putative hydrolase of the HAD superfamily
MIPKNVRAIFFDAVGTLIHPDPAASMVYFNVGRRFGSQYDSDQIGRRFRQAFEMEEDADRVGGLRTSEERERRRWQHIVGHVLDDVTDPDACFAKLYEHFAKPGAWRLEADTARVLEELKKRGYVLGMASNYDRRLRSVVAGLPLKPLEHFIISSEIGWRKPAAAFFAALCTAASFPPDKILHIGDDWANDYQGAQATGLQALLFDPKGKSDSGDALRQLSDLLL